MISKQTLLIKELSKSNQPILIISDSLNGFQKIVDETNISADSITTFTPDEGVEELRKKITSISGKSLSGLNKLFVLLNCEKFNTEQVNTLLKLLEEPPPHLITLLFSSNLSSVLATVRSRCKIFILGEQKIIYDRELRLLDYLQKPMLEFVNWVSDLSREEFSEAVFAGLEEMKKRRLNKGNFEVYRKLAEIFKKINDTNVNYKLLAEDLFVNARVKN